MKLERVIGIAFRTVIDVCKSTTVQNAKDFHAYNLIKLSCSNEMFKACLLDLIYCEKIESPDHVWEFQFLVRWPLCNYVHQADSEAAAFLYELCELPLPITDG